MTEGQSVLDHVEILKPLPAALKQQLEAHLTEKAVRAGTVVFSEGDPGDAMYFVVSGECTVFLTDKALGLSVELARIGPGQAFGEMALVTGSPRSATVKTTEDTKLRCLSREILFKLVTAAPQVGLMIASVLAKRTEELNRNQYLELGSLKGRTFDPTLVDLLPAALIKKYKMAPVARSQGAVTIATSDPSNRVAIDDVRGLLAGDRLRVLVVNEVEINAWIAAHFSGQVAKPKANITQLASTVIYSTQIAERDEDKTNLNNANSADVASLVSTIIAEALEKQASDIHLDPDKKGIVVRYRVDGQLVTRETIIPKSLHAPLMSRLKILASLNITEKRLPQDGRISFEMQGRGYDLRVATVATRYGEKMTLRVLDSASIKQSLSQLISADKVSQVVRKLFTQQNGLILVTGPTGSGKTTTLYSALRERMGQPISICTVEDPIEYDLPGVNQVQVNESAGLGYNQVLAAFMRSNPDVIFVGETRDAATAKLACNAALSGHLVISSLHTNDALAAVGRLQSMGVEPYAISGALLGVINQRLVRRLCPTCRTETHPGDAVINGLLTLGVPIDPAMKFFKAKGCQSCGGEGVKGRVGVYELLVVSQKVRDAIAQNADAVTLRSAALDGSFVSLARYATFVLGQGIVDPAEILRVVPRDQTMN